MGAYEKCRALREELELQRVYNQKMYMLEGKDGDRTSQEVRLKFSGEICRYQVLLKELEDFCYELDAVANFDVASGRQVRTYAEEMVIEE